MTTKTGPQLYPGATTGTHWYQDTWGGDSMESNVLVLHTTEGMTVPDYDGGSNAPNMTVLPRITSQMVNWYQHFEIDTSSRALVNLRGGVETNTLNAYQLEMVGTCDYSKRNTWKIGSKTYTEGVDYIYWPDAPDWLLKEVAKHIVWLHKNHNFKLNAAKMWLNYGPDDRRAGVTPASYGASPARMSGSTWENFYGICGHQHVPENDHGDPGAFPIDRLMKFVNELLGSPTPDPKPDPQPTVKYEPFPGAAWFTTGRKSPIVKAMRQRLIAEGCNKYKSNTDQDTIGSGDEDSYEAWQRKCGYSGADAKWPPGKTTWDKLKVPNVPNK